MTTITPATDEEVQIARYRSKGGGYVLGDVNISRILARLDAEKARADAAEKDAARYRWLRDGAGCAPSYIEEPMIHMISSSAYGNVLSGKDCDDAIDAAIGRDMP